MAIKSFSNVELPREFSEIIKEIIIIYSLCLSSTDRNKAFVNIQLFKKEKRVE